MKTILLSKTFWVQIVALLVLLFPAVKTWFDSNPVEYLAALAAVNELVRFATSGTVTLLPAATPEDSDSDETGTSGRLPAWLLLAGLGGLIGFAAPACTPGAGTVPFSGTLRTDQGTLHYGSVSGIELEVDQRSGK